MLLLQPHRSCEPVSPMPILTPKTFPQCVQQNISPFTKLNPIFQRAGVQWIGLFSAQHEAYSPSCCYLQPEGLSHNLPSFPGYQPALLKSGKSVVFVLPATSL